MVTDKCLPVLYEAYICRLVSSSFTRKMVELRNVRKVDQVVEQDVRWV